MRTFAFSAGSFLLIVATAIVFAGPAEALEIIHQYPTFSSHQVLTTQPLTIRFSSSLDPETVKEETFYLTAKGEGEAVPGEISIRSTLLADDTLVFTPAGPWDWGRRYEIHIDPTLADVHGDPFDGAFPDGPLMVANIPNDFEIPVYDPEAPFGMMVGSTVFMGYNPLDPEAEPEGPHQVPGMNVTGAWKYTLGSPEVLVAVIDDGIADYGDRDIRTALFINRGELPLPRDGETPCAEYDCNGDGRFDVDDYASDPRVLLKSDRAPVHVGHLLEAFSDGTDDDDNGLPDDISGWDFFRGVNEVLGVIEFPEGTHGKGECKLIAARGNDGHGDVPGICPDCRIMMVRTSQQIIYDFNIVAAGVRYAVRMGADLINYAGVPHAYNAEAHGAFLEAYAHGALTVAPSGDEMGMHHWWPAAGEDVISVKTLFPMVPVELWEGGPTMDLFGFTETYCTNYGPHVHASIPAVTGCTSDSTASTSGLIALILSYAREQGFELSAEEVRQIFIASCDDIADHCFSVPQLFGVCQPGFDMHFGYGRPDAERALLMLGDPDRGIPARIPPEVRITEPRWWETIDPSRTPVMEVHGRIDARVKPYFYEVQVARGPEPLDREFTTVCSGTSTSPVDGLLCSFPVNDLFDPGEVSGVPNSQFDYDVTLRVRASYEISGETVRGEARKVISIHTDDDPETGLVPGFPIDVGASGESSPVLYDMDGAPDGRLEIVLATSDGRVHVLRYDEAADTWGEMAGFPVDVSGGDPCVRGSIMGSPAVGDLFGDGIPLIVAATGRGEVYAIHPEGNLHEKRWGQRSPHLDGFPVSADPPPNDSTLIYGHGNAFMASPVLADLDGDGRLEIIAASMDQKAYAWRPEDRDRNGRADRLPGWPVLCRSEAGSVPAHAVCDQELPAQILATPAAGILDPDSEDPDIRDHPSVLVATSEVCGGEALTTTRLYAIYHDGCQNPCGPFLPGWPARPLAPLGDSIPIPMATGSGMAPVVAVEDCVTRIGVSSPGFFPQVIHYKGDEIGGRTVSPGLNLSSMANGAFASLRRDGEIQLIVPMLGVLDTEAEEFHLLDHKIVACETEEPFDMAAMFRVEDMPILLAPVAADLDNDGASEVVASGGGNLVHAFALDGGEAPGWPKYTQKWVTGTAAVGDIDADGLLEVVLPTHEGWLYAWETEGLACVDGRQSSDWPRFQHDERNTGFYGADVLPPARISDLEAKRIGRDRVKIAFTAPGDDWACGRAADYEVRYAHDRIDLSDPDAFAEAIPAEDVPRPSTAGTLESIVVVVPPDATSLAVRAADEEGNLSRISGTAELSTDSSGGDGGGCGCSQMDRPLSQFPTRGIRPWALFALTLLFMILRIFSARCLRTAISRQGTTYPDWL